MKPRFNVVKTVMIISRIRRRKAPLVVTVLVASSGMLYSFAWLHLTQRGMYGHFWLTPGDLWASYRTAHWVAWGAYGSLYGATGAYLTFPGLAILLSPLAVLTRALGMTEGFPLMIPHPTAWLLLGPIEIVLGSTSLFALDALSERLGVSGNRRAVACVFQGVLVWPLLVVWGHPEDAIALALAVYALISVMDGRSMRAGWLFGAAIAFQPLVVLVLPLCAARVGPRERARFLARSLGPSIALLVVPFLEDWRDTWNAVVRQPDQLALAHATPWTILAPHIARGIVASGPTRLIAMIGAAAIGYAALRKRSDDLTVVYMAGTCLGLRFVTESTLEGYYIWPALALLVVAANVRRPCSFIVAGLLGGGLTVATTVHYGEWWSWWGAAVAGLAAMALVARPRRRNAPNSAEVLGKNASVLDCVAGHGQDALPRLLETAS